MREWEKNNKLWKGNISVRGNYIHERVESTYVRIGIKLNVRARGQTDG